MPTDSVAVRFGCGVNDGCPDSSQDGVQQHAELYFSGYQLPAPSGEAPLIVISAAGRIMCFDDSGRMTYGWDLLVEYGKRKADGHPFRPVVSRPDARPHCPSRPE
ncbi:arabinosyltransferase C-terminal domain-containing protein [Nocardia sp. NPDC003693]